MFKNIDFMFYVQNVISFLLYMVYTWWQYYCKYFPLSLIFFFTHFFCLLLKAKPENSLIFHTIFLFEMLSLHMLAMWRIFCFLRKIRCFLQKHLCFFANELFNFFFHFLYMLKIIKFNNFPYNLCNLFQTFRKKAGFKLQINA